MKKNKCVIYVLVALLIIFTNILSSCTYKVKPYEVPVFELKQEEYKTLKVEKQDIYDYEKLRLVIDTFTGMKFSFEYKEQEGCLIYVKDPGAVVKKDAILAVINSEELDYELRLAEEDLELKQLLYNELNKRYSNTNEGYIDMCLAELDVEQGQFKLDKVFEKMESLKIKAPKDGIIKEFYETYVIVKDSFGNQSKIITVNYTYEIDNYSMKFSTTNIQTVDSLSNLSKDDIIKIYDPDFVEYEVRVTDIDISSFYNYRASKWNMSATVTVEFVKQVGIDYNKIVKYALYYDVILKDFKDVIIIKKSLVHSDQLNDYYVYVLKNGKKTIQHIAISGEVLNATSYIVLDGLIEGELIITDTILR